MGPSVRGQVTHVPGSTLSGTLDHGSAELDPRAVWGVKLAVFALEALPETELEPAGPEIELITTERGATAIAPHARLGAGTRIGLDEDLVAFMAALEAGAHGRSAPVARLVGALPRDVTTVFSLTERGGRAAELRLSRTSPPSAEESPDPESIRLTLVLEGTVAAEDEDSLDGIEQDEKEKAAAERQAPRLIVQREAVLLRPRRPPDGGIALLLPSPFESSPAAALAAALEIRPAAEWTEEDRPRFEAALSRCREDLAAATDSARPGEGRSSNADSLRYGLVVAVEELDVPSRSRASLIYLSDSTGARLAADLALAAPDDLAARLAKAVATGASEERPGDERAVAWLLTRCSYRLLVETLEERGATANIEGLLAVHAGEAGRHGPVLQDVLGASGSLEEFEARLVGENLIYLEDTSPTSRSRAFRWLEARGLAPEGYDPLGTVKERRAALARTAENAEDTVEESR